jgi:hypothetical protein
MYLLEHPLADQFAGSGCLVGGISKFNPMFASLTAYNPKFVSLSKFDPRHEKFFYLGVSDSFSSFWDLKDQMATREGGSE